MVRDTLNKLLDFFIYLKFCMNRTNSHVVILSSIAEKMALCVILFKLFNISSYWIIALAGVILTVIMIYLGHLDLQLNIASKETSLSNKYNPEIQSILKGVKK